MSKPLTLNEVQTFAQGIEVKSVLVHSPKLGIILASIFFFSIAIGILGYRFERVTMPSMLGILGTIIVSLGTFVTPSSELRTDYDAKKLEWENEYADRYIEELQVFNIKNIEKARYDYELEASRDSKPEVHLDSEKPIIVTMEDGKKQTFWAEVIVKENVDKPFMEYRYLETDLHFKEGLYPYREKGYQSVKYYTNKPLRGN